MKKKFTVILLALVLALSLVPAAAFAESEGSLQNFSASREYTGQFTDVPAGHNFEKNIASAYRLGLMYGKTDTDFNMKGNVSIAEAIVMAARIRSIYYTGQAVFEHKEGDPWYKAQLDYALENGIIQEGYADYSRDCTRADYAKIMAGALPDEALPAVNQLEDGKIPDVPMSRSYAPYVYKLYRAGVLVGNDKYGTFTPDSFITRGAVAALVTRMADKSLRVETTFAEVPSVLNAEQISEKCAGAVFYIDLFDAGGESIGSGSGFFIDPNGTAVTNYHVIYGAHSAKAVTTDGISYEITGILGSDGANDLAIIKVDGSEFDTLSFGDSKNIKAGQTVYAIGSPYGFDNTISQGIISNVKRNMDGVDYIQTTAPISPGSSGGALLNDKGEVIGVTAAFISEAYAQSLNLAIPVDLVNEIERSSEPAPLSSNVTLSLSSTIAVTQVGRSYTVIANLDQVDQYTLTWICDDYQDIISCEWGEWFNGSYSIPLTIKGVAPGFAIVEIQLKDKYDNYISSEYVMVTVVK